MIVDDDKDQIFTIKNAFEELYDKEYLIIPAESGKECFELLKNKTIPDLILLDIMMPSMDGWTVFDKLRANPSWKHIPIVFLTARTDGFAENAGGLIADGFIKKPIDVKELKIRIDSILKKRKK